MRKKVKRTGKNGEEIIYSTRFTTILLSNLVSNLAEGIHKMKCKCGFEDKKKCQTCGVKYKGFLSWIHKHFALNTYVR